MMSKAERDQICDAIEDEPGARAKRRRDIEEMDEEEVEADIKRTHGKKIKNAMLNIEN
jgi:hypothetical protein